MEKANKIFINGKIYTENPDMPWAEAVAFAGKRIAGVGSNDACRAMAAEDAEIIDLEEKTVLPGIIDGHTHPTTIAKTQWHVRMPLTTNKEDLYKNIAEYAKRTDKEEQPFLYMESYFTETFGSEGPKKEDLDKLISDRPARIQDFGDHACWYNSMAVDMLGIADGSGMIDSPAGEAVIMRNDKGEPTGWVMEASPEGDIGIYEKTGWMPPTDATEEMLAPFLDFLKSYGVIALFDGFTEGEEAIKLFYEMDKGGRLNMFYDASVIMADTADLEDSIKTLREWQRKYTTDHISVNTIKYFIDGTNELGDCSSLEPFSNDPEGKNYGHQNCTTEEMTQVLIRLNEENIDLHVHTICDRAFRTMVDAVEAAKAACGNGWRIYVTLAHCELADFEDQKRAAELGIFIDWTCHWSGGYFGDAAIQYLGRKRWDTMYNFSSFLEAGGTLGFSSDLFSYQEATRGNPFFGMKIAMTRIETWVPLDPEKYPGSMRPSESGKYTLEQLLRGYTANNAFRMRHEDKLGSIAKGKIANMIVLNQDIFDTPAQQLDQIKADAVYFEGRLSDAKNTLEAERD